MDVDAIIARRPQVVLIDELAHTNIDGSKHRKRFEDVQEILAAKIDVLSTLNIQHVESIAPTVHDHRDHRARDGAGLGAAMANETVMGDLTPEALQNRLRRGDVYSPEKVEQALKNFFRRGNLIALRELALRQVAEQWIAAWNPTWPPRRSRTTGRCASGWRYASAPTPRRNT